VIPEFRQTELRNTVERISADLCISRPKSRLDWGIELPFDKNFVTYVWFDALTNYITFAGYDPSLSTINSQTSNFLDKWPALQIIGKDVLVPAHGIYWLIMLHAIGFPDDQMPQLLVHGWWNIGGAKMSKSVGNIVDPVVLADKYSADALRYYLMSDMATGQDADFSEERLIERYNNDLANSLGNLANRSLNMLHRYKEGRLDRTFEKDPLFLRPDGWWNSPSAASEGFDNRPYLAAHLRTISAFTADIILAEFSQTLRRCEIHYLIGFINHLVNLSNKLVEIAAPWKLVKEANREAELHAVLYHLAEALRIIAILLSPVVPKAAHGIFDQLNWKMEPELHGKEERFSLADTEWGKLPDGHVVGKPVPLFPRLER
jgi:methionyl-tRNA synthetase